MEEKFGVVVGQGKDGAEVEISPVWEGIGVSHQTREVQVDTNLQNDIMTPEEVAQFLHKSPSWVYKNWQLLGRTCPSPSRPFRNHRPGRLLPVTAGRSVCSGSGRGPYRNLARRESGIRGLGRVDVLRARQVAPD